MYFIAPINSISMLVRRKILRLYFNLLSIIWRYFHI